MRGLFGCVANRWERFQVNPNKVLMMGAGIISALVIMGACVASADRFCYNPGFIPQSFVPLGAILSIPQGADDGAGIISRSS